MKQQQLKVLMVIPSVNGSIECTTAKSIFDLKIPPYVQLDVEFMHGYTLPQSRNRCVLLAKERGVDYIFWVDSDIVLPDNALMDLLALNLPFASGWYCKKVPEILPRRLAEVFSGSGNYEAEQIAAKTEPFAVEQGVGFGCCLTHISLFPDDPNHYWFRYQEDGTSMCSEDLTFCKAVKDSGVDLIVHPAIYCMHIGKMTW